MQTAGLLPGRGGREGRELYPGLLALVQAGPQGPPWSLFVLPLGRCIRPIGFMLSGASDAVRAGAPLTCALSLVAEVDFRSPTLTRLGGLLHASVPGVCAGR